MASNPRFESVPLDQIDTADDRYKISTGGPSGTLVASIHQIGVLTPPVLYPRQDGIRTIVSGFRRIAALKKIGQKETVARILGENTPILRRIEIAIADNVMQRKLNPVEQGRAILLLDSLHADAVALCDAATRLGVPVNQHSAQKLRMVAQMRSSLRKALINGGIALPVVIELAGMEDKACADQLAEMIGAMGLGLNRQRELLDWLKAIAMREGIALKTLLDHEQVQQIFGDPQMDPKQKNRLLRNYFMQRRYPEVTQAETEFQAIINTLKFDKNIRLEPPRHFEGRTFCLQIYFSSHEELISGFRSLETSIQSQRMASLWDLFKVS